MLNYTYLLLILSIVAYPLFKSFENKVEYYYKWKYLFPAIIITSIFFIVWDVWFTKEHIWSFNPTFILGWKIKGLPFEEWLFFFVVPFACVFVYEVLNYFIKKDVLGKNALLITILLAALLLSFGLIYNDKLYTFCTFISLAALLIYHIVIKSKYLGKFYLAYLVCLIPFFVINGFLTYLPVVQYSDYENMAVRVFTIPIEDFFYWMLNFLMVITIYEWLKPNH